MNVLRSPSGSSSQPDLSKLDDATTDTRVTFRSKRKLPKHDCECNNDITELRKDLSNITLLLEKLTAVQENGIKTIQDTVSEIKNEINAIKSSTASVVAEQSNIKSQLKHIDSRISTQDAKIECLQMNLSDKNTITPTQFSEDLKKNEIMFREMQERNNRAKNIIIVGLNEQNSSVVSERQLMDEKEINNILLSAFKDCPKPIKIFRFGKFSSDKSRSIKVCFDTQEAPKLLLRNKDKFPKDIKCYSDQTPMQQKYLKDLKEELKNRLQNGETNLTIKYQNGIPMINSLAPKN